MDKRLPLEHTIPLAERMRPESIDDFFGQPDLLGAGKPLGELLKSGLIPSMILWGPPGTGKTSLARIISQMTGATFIFFSAVLSGVPEVRRIVNEARERRKTDPNAKTIFFVDEIHRFNKSQQDAFLPHVESGLFTLIGATTENPSFQVIAPLLSRCRVLVLSPLSEDALLSILNNCLCSKEKGLGNYPLEITSEARSFLLSFADGDARRLLNMLEIAATLALQQSTEKQRPAVIDLQTLDLSLQQKTLRYDKKGEEHYNLISALHKSLRDSDPDGALYWLYRMLESGEDPLYIARRMIRFASEDIGVSDPNALVQAMAGRDACHTLGLPEGELALAQTVIYLATAPKSNALYRASKAVKKLISKTGSLPVPLHIRNSPTRLMKELGYGQGYQYAHDHPDALVNQNHLPAEIENTIFYQPSTRGYEAVIGDRLKKWKKILSKRK
ncbi:MAG: AAA family ATPase [Proteobacteria bacterium]|nr:MAG: AAA family ATPase [Pseudomonadota bacterium]